MDNRSRLRHLPWWLAALSLLAGCTSNDVCFSPDGVWLAVGHGRGKSGGEVDVYSMTRRRAAESMPSLPAATTGVVFIDEGKLLYDGTLDVLKERFGGKRQLVVYLAEDYPNVAVEGAQVCEHKGLQVTYEFERQALTASELIGRVSARYRVQDLEVR